MTEIPEGLQTPAAAGAAAHPPPLQHGVADAHGFEVEFDLDDLIDAPAPNFIAFGHDPAVLDPAAVANAWALGGAPSGDDMYAPPETMAHFVKGHSVHGDVHAFSKAMTRYIQGGRMSAYDTTRQAQAWASRCDGITHGIIQRIMLPHPQSFSLADVRQGGECSRHSFGMQIHFTSTIPPHADVFHSNNTLSCDLCMKQHFKSIHSN